MVLQKRRELQEMVERKAVKRNAVLMGTRISRYSVVTTEPLPITHTERRIAKRVFLQLR